MQTHQIVIRDNLVLLLWRCFFQVGHYGLNLGFQNFIYGRVIHDFLETNYYDVWVTVGEQPWFKIELLIGFNLG
jgi:hypothetical protein